MRFRKCFVAGMAFSLWPLALFAQSAASPDPAEATAPVPATRYESVFSGYLPYQEQSPGAWREHNDEMARVGGHAGHLKSNPSPSGAEMPATSDKPKDATDSGSHHKHGGAP